MIADEIDAFVAYLLGRLPLPKGASIINVKTGSSVVQPAYYDASFLASDEEKTAADLPEGPKHRVFKIMPVLLMRDQRDALQKAGATVDNDIMTVTLLV